MEKFSKTIFLPHSVDELFSFPSSIIYKSIEKVYSRCQKKDVKAILFG